MIFNVFNFLYLLNMKSCFRVIPLFGYSYMVYTTDTGQIGDRPG